MNYKVLFHRVLLLISSPAKAWEEIRVEEDRRRVFTDFVYPMIGLCGLSVFLGTIFSYGWSGPQAFQLSMTKCCSVAVSLFGGYFLAAYLINLIGMRLFRMGNDLLTVQQFAGYALSLSFMIQIVTGVLPDIRVIGWLLQFYTIYIVSEGVPVLLNVPERQRLKYVLIASFLLLFCPIAIQYLFDEITLILN